MVKFPAWYPAAARAEVELVIREQELAFADDAPGVGHTVHDYDPFALDPEAERARAHAAFDQRYGSGDSSDDQCLSSVLEPAAAYAKGLRLALQSGDCSAAQAADELDRVIRELTCDVYERRSLQGSFDGLKRRVYEELAQCEWYHDIQLASTEAKQASEPQVSGQTDHSSFTVADAATSKEASTAPALPAATAKWEDVQIRFLSDERVQITTPTNTETRNYAELDLEDRRSGKPRKAWDTVLDLAERKGILPVAPGGRERVKVEKRIEELRKALRQHFNRQDDPILCANNGSAYQARFTITRARAHQF